MTTLDGVYINEDTANAINTSQITSLKDGQIDFVGAVTYDLSNVADLTNTTVNVAGSGRIVAFPKTTTIDGASFFVSGGAICRCPWPRITIMHRRVTTKSAISRPWVPAVSWI